MNYSYLIVSVLCKGPKWGLLRDCEEVGKLGVGGDWRRLGSAAAESEYQRHVKDGPAFKVNSHEYMVVNPCCVLLQLLIYRKRESVE